MHRPNVLRVAGIALAVLAAATIVSAQPLPAMLYGDTLDDRCHAIVADLEPGYCLAGWTRNFGQGQDPNRRILLVKTDNMGLPIWARVSTGHLDEVAHSMVRTSDQGYCLTGWTESFGHGSPNRSVFAIKVDYAGTLVWAWVWGLEDAGSNEGYSITETFDGGFAIVGRTESAGDPPRPNILVLKLDANGGLQWARAYWNGLLQGVNEGYAIIQTPDTGYAIVGRARISSRETFDPFVMKLDQHGTFRWARYSPGPEDDEGRSATLARDGIVAGGWTGSYGTAPGRHTDIFVANFALDGHLTWAHTYGWEVGDERLLQDRSLTTAHDGTVAACGPTGSVGPGVPYPNFLLLKLDPGGLPEWCVSHPSPDHPGLYSNVPHAIVQDAEHNYAAAGWSDSYPYLGAGDDFHLLVVDSAGRREVCVERQQPVMGEMPWEEVRMADEDVRFEVQEMTLVPVEVRHVPICDGGPVQEDASRGPAPAGRTALRFLPNPAGLVTAVAGLDGPAGLKLYDVSGREAARFRLSGRPGEQLSLKGLESGVYLAIVDRDGLQSRPVKLLVR